MESSREFRLLELFRRLQALPPAKNFAEAYRQIEDTLNQVEDELTSIPFNPQNWEIDGRMYPPQEDNVRAEEGYTGVFRLRSRGHSTFIASNGAMEIRRSRRTGRQEDEESFVSKPGADGRGVWQ